MEWIITRFRCSDVICNVHCRLCKFSRSLGSVANSVILLVPRLDITGQQKRKPMNTGRVWDDCEVQSVSPTRSRKELPVVTAIRGSRCVADLPRHFARFFRSLQNLERYARFAAGVRANLRAFTLSCLSIKKARELLRGLLMANQLLLLLMQHPFAGALQSDQSSQVNIVCVEVRRAD
jgi:hypothetical protein